MTDIASGPPCPSCNDGYGCECFEAGKADDRASIAAWLHERAEDAIAKSAMLEDRVAGPRLRAMNAWGHQLALGVERGEDRATP